MTEDRGGRPGRTATARAEELVDRMGEGVGHLASLAGWRILRAAAFVREEAEDVWAEAQSVRRAQSARGPRQAEHHAGPVGASVFDPANGAEVVSGPARKPLPETPLRVEGDEVVRG